MSDLTVILTKLQDVEQKFDKLRNDFMVLSLKGGKEWISIAEACELANCKEEKLRQLIEAGHIISSKSGNKGALVVISRKSINKYFETQIYKPAYAIKRRV